MVSGMKKPPRHKQPSFIFQLLVIIFLLLSTNKSIEQLPNNGVIPFFQKKKNPTSQLRKSKNQKERIEKKPKLTVKPIKKLFCRHEFVEGIFMLLSSM